MLIMVLNDEETWTDLHGCMIVNMPDDYEDSEIDWAQAKIITKFVVPGEAEKVLFDQAKFDEQIAKIAATRDDIDGVV